MEDSADRNAIQNPTRPGADATELARSQVLSARDVGNVHWFQVRQSDAERNNTCMANWHVDHVVGFKLNH